MKNQDFLASVRAAVKEVVRTAFTPQKTRGMAVYDEVNEEQGLDMKFAGKVVAIEIDTKKVVGVGDSVEAAYADARGKTDSKKLYFKKVGKDYLFKL